MKQKGQQKVFCCSKQGTRVLSGTPATAALGLNMARGWGGAGGGSLFPPILLRAVSQLSPYGALLSSLPRSYLGDLAQEPTLPSD